MSEEIEENPISFREFGRRYGITDASVRFYIKREYLKDSLRLIKKKGKKDKPCLIESLAVKELRKNFKEDWGKSESATGETKATIEKEQKQETVKTSAKNSEEKVVKIPSEMSGIQLVNLKKAQAELEKIEMENKVKKGELISFKDVQTALFSMGSEVKDTFQGFPDKYVDEVMVAAMESRFAARECLMRAVNFCLGKIGDLSDIKIKR